MTFPLGSDAVRRAVEAQMLGNYRVRHLIDLTDFRHRRVQTLTSSRIGGTVQVNTGTEGVTRSLSLDLFDPTDMLGLGDGSRTVAPNRMLRVRKGIFVDSLGEWVDIPVFYGPIEKPSRNEDVLTIEAQDKARFAVDPRTGFSLKAGTNVRSAIIALMRDAVGESRFRVASTSRKLARSHSLSREQTPWQLLQRICKSVGWVAFYDGDGYLVCRPPSSSPVATFRAGKSLMSGVQAGFWTENVVNRVVVLGGVISKTRIVAVATLAKDHPLSPESLAFGGKPWPRTEYIENDDIGTLAEANALAKARVAVLAQQQTSAAFEARPFWHLQEFDAYRVQTPDGMFTTTVTEMTIPLDCEGSQSMGANTRTPRSRRKVRVRPKQARLKRAEANAAAARRRARAKAAAAARKKKARKK